MTKDWRSNRVAPWVCAFVVVAGCANAHRHEAPISAGAPMQDAVPPTAALGKASPIAATTTAARKIIRDADVTLDVGDLDAASASLRASVRAIGDAYVATEETTGAASSQRAGSWTIRVPEAQLDAFVESLGRLGVPSHVRVGARDVSEEWVDTDARLKNKRAEETRLLHHLEASTGKLDEILAVERELARVRGDVEQAEARMRVLADQTTLATVHVSMTEGHAFVPAQEPALAAAARATFHESLVALGRASRVAVLVVVALAPWIFVAGLFAATFVGWHRRARRRSRTP